MQVFQEWDVLKVTSVIQESPWVEIEKTYSVKLLKCRKTHADEASRVYYSSNIRNSHGNLKVLKRNNKSPHVRKL